MHALVIPSPSGRGNPVRDVSLGCPDEAMGCLMVRLDWPVTTVSFLAMTWRGWNEESRGKRLCLATNPVARQEAFGSVP